MSQTLGHWAKTAAAVLALGRLMPAAGWAALAAALIVAGVVCWILSSPERTDRAARLIGAARGQAAALPASPPAAGYKNRRRRGRQDKGDESGTGHGEAVRAADRAARPAGWPGW